MPEEEKSKNLGNRFKEVVENASKLAGLVVAVIAAIAFASGNSVFSYAFILIACASVDWLLWTTLASSREKQAKLVIAERSGELLDTVGRVSAPRKAPAIVLITIVTLASLGWIGINGYQDYQRVQSDALTAQGYYTPTATPNEQLIILAEFDASGSKKYDTNKRIFERLQEELQKANISNARIVQIPIQTQKVSTEDEARALGQRHQAVFVIWGKYDDAGITTKFTVIKESSQLPMNTYTQQVLAEPARDFSLYVSQGLPAQMSYLALFTLGQLYFINQQYDQAVNSFSGAIEIDPTIADAYNNRGIVYFAQDKPEQAIADYNKAIELDPKLALTYNNRGIIYSSQNNPEQAIADCSKAIELDPQLAVAYGNRGIAYRQKGLKAEAIADFETYLRFSPSAPDRVKVEQLIHALQAQ